MDIKKITSKVVPILSVSLLASCGLFNHNDGEEIDLSKTQLYVAAVRSGVEDGWLQDLAAKFSEKYKDYSFEEGKTGIQVHVDGDKTAYSGDQLETTSENDKHVVYCVEGVKYNNFINPVQKALNLKNIINVKKSDGNQFYTEEKSILDRMDQQFKDAFVKEDGNIYMIPYYESFCSFQYDRDVFENPKNFSNYSFYFRRSDLVIQDHEELADYYDDVNNSDVAPLYDGFDSNDKTFPFGDLFCTKNEDPSHRNYGPDGIEGTFDDGLPQTFKEFEVLLKVMAKAGYKPILGNSTYNYYFADMLASIWANEEGIDNMNLNFKWEGTANDLIKIQNNTINGDELVYDSPTTINSSNAYELHRQEGVYRALQFADIIAKSDPRTDLAFTAAQNLLIDTKFNSSPGYDFGLICDGNWWENEVKGSFYGDSSDPHNRLNRNLSFFTFPKSSAKKWDSTIGEQTFYNINNSTCFLNKNLETTNSNLMEAATAFFYYINSNEGMSAFTTSTSISRPFEYTITDSDQNKISAYGKDMMKLRSYFSAKTGDTAGYNICSCYPLSDIVSEKEGNVHKYEWNFQISGSTKEKAIPTDIMKKDGLTPEQYFVNSYNYSKTHFR